MTNNQRRRIHVLPHNGSWAVRSETSKRLTIFDAKSEAIDEASKRANRDMERVLVYGRSGQIFQHPVAVSELSDEVVRKAVRSVGSRAPASHSVHRIPGGNRMAPKKR